MQPAGPTRSRRSCRGSSARLSFFDAHLDLRRLEDERCRALLCLFGREAQRDSFPRQRRKIGRKGSRRFARKERAFVEENRRTFRRDRDACAPPELRVARGRPNDRRERGAARAGRKVDAPHHGRAGGEDEVESAEVLWVGGSDAIAREELGQVRGLEGDAPDGDVSLQEVRPLWAENRQMEALEELAERGQLAAVRAAPLEEALAATRRRRAPLAQARGRGGSARGEVERLVLPCAVREEEAGGDRREARNGEGARGGSDESREPQPERRHRDDVPL